MGSLSRRNVLATGAAATAAALGLSGCGDGRSASAGTGRAGDAAGSSRSATPPVPAQAARLIGDGSTSDTGPQPQPAARPERLAPGERPPQFVVFSWDGAGEDDKQLFSHFRQVAQETNATMTFFLSGIYTLPKSQRMLYAPPDKPWAPRRSGTSNDDHVRATHRAGRRRPGWRATRSARTSTGTSATPKGVGTWSPEQWRSEIEQAVGFVTPGRPTPASTIVDALPFDYSKELTGGRTPCLLGQDQLLPTARELGWTYDASSPGGLQIWPTKRHGLWDFPLQSIPLPNTNYTVLSMDYNIMYNQIGPEPDRRPVAPPVLRADRPPSRTWPVSTGRTRRTGRRSSSATTSRPGTAGST